MYKENVVKVSNGILLSNEMNTLQIHTITWMNQKKHNVEQNKPEQKNMYYREFQNRELKDNRAVRRGDHLSPHKYIRNTSTCGTTPTEHLLNAGRRPQTSQKARNSHIPGHVADRVLVLWPGVRPVPLRWESRVQDIGPPATSRLHVISNSESSLRDLHLNATTQLHSTTSKLQCCQTTSNTETQPNPLPERLPKIMLRSQIPQNAHGTRSCPPERQDPVSSTRTQTLVPSTRKPAQPTEPTLPTGGRHQKQREL